MYVYASARNHTPAGDLALFCFTSFDYAPMLPIMVLSFASLATDTQHTDQFVFIIQSTSISAAAIIKGKTTTKVLILPISVLSSLISEQMMSYVWPRIAFSRYGADPESRVDVITPPFRGNVFPSRSFTRLSRVTVTQNLYYDRIIFKV